jgi:hypothetical protein
VMRRASHRAARVASDSRRRGAWARARMYVGSLDMVVCMCGCGCVGVCVCVCECVCVSCVCVGVWVCMEEGRVAVSCILCSVLSARVAVLNAQHNSHSHSHYSHSVNATSAITIEL